MQPKAKHSLRAQAQLMRTETVETFELVKVKQKLLDIRAEKERSSERRTRERLEPIDENSACVEVGKPIDENSACVEVGTTHKHLRRGDKSNNFKNYFSSNDITCEEETATHIGIREAEDWFRPIDLAKECDFYISSRSGSHKEIPITYGYTQDPFKNRSQNFKPKVKENYPQYHERENKNCYICGDSSHCARDCEKRFKPKESNDHIHNRINVNTLKVESEKQNSEECANLQYVNIFVENQPVTALIDSGCQIPVFKFLTN
ncbi:hypothetical protein TNCV_3489421 [Trichonephila clavipes]|nr:hypothetical protein TNCV_3489421 [Trichonephila clavipes]